MLQGAGGCAGLLQPRQELCHTGRMQSSTVGYMYTPFASPQLGVSVSVEVAMSLHILWSLVPWGVRDLEQGAAMGQS